MNQILAAGTFEGFYRVASDLLGFLYRITNSYGGAIVLLTIVVMAVTAPLTLKSTRSMVQMQRHQPELRRLQAKYKDDREKLNQEVMALYKEHGINPLSGCVPMLMQAPIFLVLYGVLRGITHRSGGPASGIGRVAGNLAAGRPFEPWKVHDQVFEPQHLSSSSQLYQSLEHSTTMKFFGVDLALTPIDAVRIGVVVAIPFLVLMILLLISQLIQQRQIQGRTSGEVNPQQQAIMKIIPYTLPAFSFVMPAGLGLYYFVQGLCRIGLQGYITRSIYVPHKATMEEIEAKAKEKGDAAGKGASKSGGKKVDRPATTAGRDGTAAKGAPKPNAPKSAKSAAVQRKASGAAAPGGGRKSGDPRVSGRSRPSGGTPGSKKGK